MSVALLSLASFGGLFFFFERFGNTVLKSYITKGHLQKTYSENPFIFCCKDVEEKRKSLSADYSRTEMKVRNIESIVI